jgi:hypothetical protein
MTAVRWAPIVLLAAWGCGETVIRSPISDSRQVLDESPALVLSYIVEDFWWEHDRLPAPSERAQLLETTQRFWQLRHGNRFDHRLSWHVEMEGDLVKVTYTQEGSPRHWGNWSYAVTYPNSPRRWHWLAVNEPNMSSGRLETKDHPINAAHFLGKRLVVKHDVQGQVVRALEELPQDSFAGELQRLVGKHDLTFTYLEQDGVKGYRVFIPTERIMIDYPLEEPHRDLWSDLPKTVSPKPWNPEEGGRDEFDRIPP